MTKKRILGTVVALTAMLAVARPASAALFDIYAAVRGGGAWGKGVNTLQSTSADYFKTNNGPGFGAQIGARLLFVDLSISGTQFVNDKGLQGMYFDAIAGVGGSIPLGEAKSPADFMRIGAGVGFAVGTLATVDPPLSNDQIRNKGVVGQAVVAWDHYMGRFLSVGLEMNAGYHYFFLGGDAVANSNENQSQGIHVLGFLTFRLHLIPEREASEPEPKQEYTPMPAAGPAPRLPDPSAPPPPEAFTPPARGPSSQDSAPAPAQN